jgi:hypothetical protein
VRRDRVLSDNPTVGTARETLEWVFRDRRTGRIVIAQLPNVPLAVWIIAVAIRFFVHGTTNTVLTVIATVALALWAGDEIIRGVNPWRRFLGTVVLCGLIVSVSTNA